MSDHRECRILIAMDPGEEELKPEAAALKELRYWAGKVKPRLEAVHVLQGSDRDPRFNQEYTRAFDALNRSVEEMDLGVPVHSRVIWDHDDLIEDPVGVLIKRAQEFQASMILVTSHGRRWLSRLVMGSFAEKLLMDSPVPVLFFGNLPDPKDSFRRVMFATDFSDYSKKAYELFLKHVAPLEPEVLVYHVAEYPNMITGMSLTGVGAYLPETYWKVMRESLISEGEIWVRLAKRAGIRARTILEDGVGDVGASIQRAASGERVSLIGMATMRNDFQKLVLGSITKRIARSPIHSVWILGPKGIEAIEVSQRPSHRSTESRP